MTITESAWSAATAAALAALPTETGGILTGWRRTDSVHIADALTVPDDRAGSQTYCRTHHTAQEHLDAYLADQDDPNLGYVGEWHTHPLPHPPSQLDLASLRGAARRLSWPIALLVIAVGKDQLTATGHVHVTTRGRFNRLSVAEAALTVLKPDPRTQEK